MFRRRVVVRSASPQRRTIVTVVFLCNIQCGVHIILYEMVNFRRLMAADTETLQNAAAAHPTSTMERRASHWGRASQSHIVPHVLTSGAICNSHRGRTLSAASKVPRRCNARRDRTLYAMWTLTSKEACTNVVSTNELEDIWCDGCNYVQYCRPGLPVAMRTRCSSGPW